MQASLLKYTYISNATSKLCVCPVQQTSMKKTTKTTPLSSEQSTPLILVNLNTLQPKNEMSYKSCQILKILSNTWTYINIYAHKNIFCYVKFTHLSSSVIYWTSELISATSYQIKCSIPNACSQFKFTGTKRVLTGQKTFFFFFLNNRKLTITLN